ncbi:MAG: NAD(P)/FAD-dependent oxidoreductase [Gemmatimonadetes bacterium]|nr:NAD(P)/FAD-dependent oxidoreductase [Gemmatimonadota bacterium]
MTDSRDTVDVTIIGGGPTGLYGLFYAGMREVSARVIDTLPELGGQLTALYPEKDVFDVGGFPRILAKDLAAELVEQGLQFGAEVCLGEQVMELNPRENMFDLTTDAGPRPTRSIVIAGGKGSFKSREIKAPGWDDFIANGIDTHVADPEKYRDKRVLIVGGGDSAFDWSLGLSDIAAELTQIHRSDKFRAHERTVEQVREKVTGGFVELLTYQVAAEFKGGDRVESVTIMDTKSKERRDLEVDCVLALIGFVPSLGPIADWGLEIEKNRIVVDQRMRTNVPGVYAAGDITTYDGKLDLISTGFGEAAIAVNNAVHHVDPTARVNPGHSTSSKAFN